MTAANGSPDQAGAGQPALLQDRISSPKALNPKHRFFQRAGAAIKNIVINPPPDIHGPAAKAQYARAMARIDADIASKLGPEGRADRERIAKENKRLAEYKEQKQARKAQRKAERAQRAQNVESSGLVGVYNTPDRTPPPGRDPHNEQSGNTNRSANGGGRPDRGGGRPPRGGSHNGRGRGPYNAGLLGGGYYADRDRPPGGPENGDGTPRSKADVVKGYIAHTREVQRLRQQERSFFGKMIHGFSDRLTVYYGAWKLKNFVDAYRADHGEEPIFTDALVKGILDSRGFFRVRGFDNLSAEAQFTGKAHGAMLKLAKKDDASQIAESDTSRQRSRDLITELLKRNRGTQLSAEELAQLKSKYAELDESDFQAVADALNSVYKLGETSGIKFINKDAFIHSVSDQLLYAGLSPEQQDQARKIAIMTHIGAATTVASIAAVHFTGGLSLWWQSALAQGAVSGISRVPTLLGQGASFEFNQMRMGDGGGVMSKNPRPGGRLELAFSRTALARWLAVDWKQGRGSYPWQIIRASVLGGAVGAAMHGIEHVNVGDAIHGVEGFTGSIGHDIQHGLGLDGVHHATEAAVQAHMELATQTLPFSDFLHQHGISNVDFQHHVTVSPDAQHGATWAYDVSNHWTPHSMTWNVYAHGDQINYFTLHLPNNQVAIVDLAHSSIHPGPHGEYSFTFDAHNTTDHFTLIDIKGHPVGTISSEQAFQLWHTTGQLPHSGASSDFSYATQGYVRGLTEFGHFDAAKDVFVRYGEVQGHGGFGDLHNVTLTTLQTVHGGPDVDGNDALTDGIVTPQGIAVHDALEHVADWGGEATDWVMTHEPETALIILSVAAGYVMGRKRTDRLFAGSELGLATGLALAPAYFIPGYPIGLAAGYLLGRVGGKKKTSSDEKKTNTKTDDKTESSPKGFGDETELTKEQKGFVWPEGTAPTGGGSGNGGSGGGRSGDAVNSTVPGATGNQGMPPAPQAPVNSTAAVDPNDPNNQLNANLNINNPIPPAPPIAPVADPANPEEVRASGEAVEKALAALRPPVAQPGQPAPVVNVPEAVAASRKALQTPLTPEGRERLENALRATPYGRALLAERQLTGQDNRDRALLQAAQNGNTPLTPEELDALSYVVDPRANPEERGAVKGRLETLQAQMRQETEKRREFERQLDELRKDIERYNLRGRIGRLYEDLENQNLTRGTLGDDIFDFTQRYPEEGKPDIPRYREFLTNSDLGNLDSLLGKVPEFKPAEEWEKDPQLVHLVNDANVRRREPVPEEDRERILHGLEAIIPRPKTQYDLVAQAQQLIAQDASQSGAVLDVMDALPGGRALREYEKIKKERRGGDNPDDTLLNDNTVVKRVILAAERNPLVIQGIGPSQTPVSLDIPAVSAIAQAIWGDINEEHMGVVYGTYDEILRQREARGNDTGETAEDGEQPGRADASAQPNASSARAADAATPVSPFTGPTSALSVPSPRSASAARAPLAVFPYSGQSRLPGYADLPSTLPATALPNNPAAAQAGMPAQQPPVAAAAAPVVPPPPPTLPIGARVVAKGLNLAAAPQSTHEASADPAAQSGNNMRVLGNPTADAMIAAQGDQGRGAPAAAPVVSPPPARAPISGTFEAVRQVAQLDEPPAQGAASLAAAHAVPVPQPASDAEAIPAVPAAPVAPAPAEVTAESVLGTEDGLDRMDPPPAEGRISSEQVDGIIAQIKLAGNEKAEEVRKALGRGDKNEVIAAVNGMLADDAFKEYPLRELLLQTITEQALGRTDWSRNVQLTLPFANNVEIAMAGALFAFEGDKISENDRKRLVAEFGKVPLARVAIAGAFALDELRKGSVEDNYVVNVIINAAGQFIGSSLTPQDLRQLSQIALFLEQKAINDENVAQMEDKIKASIAMRNEAHERQLQAVAQPATAGADQSASGQSALTNFRTSPHTPQRVAAEPAQAESPAPGPEATSASAPASEPTTQPTEQAPASAPTAQPTETVPASADPVTQAASAPTSEQEPIAESAPAVEAASIATEQVQGAEPVVESASAQPVEAQTAAPVTEAPVEEPPTPEPLPTERLAELEQMSTEDRLKALYDQFGEAHVNEVAQDIGEDNPFLETALSAERQKDRDKNTGNEQIYEALIDAYRKRSGFSREAIDDAYTEMIRQRNLQRREDVEVNELENAGQALYRRDWDGNESDARVKLLADFYRAMNEYE